MTGAGFVEKIEFLVGKNEPFITKGQDEVCPRSPWPQSVPSFTRQESWKMAKSCTTSTLALVSHASRTPFSKTLAQWLTPCVPCQGKA